MEGVVQSWQIHEQKVPTNNDRDSGDAQESTVFLQAEAEMQKCASHETRNPTTLQSCRMQTRHRTDEDEDPEGAGENPDASRHQARRGTGTTPEAEIQNEMRPAATYKPMQRRAMRRLRGHLRHATMKKWKAQRNEAQYQLMRQQKHEQRES